jgi:lysozyme
MKNPKFRWYNTTKIDLKLAVVSIGFVIAAIVGCGKLLFDAGIILVNHPDRDRFPIRGIDISNYQPNIDWDLIDRSQVNFVLMKATEGGDFKDPLFKNNWQHVQQKGLTPGAYHFFTFCKSGQEQAKNYIEMVPLSQATLPPVIDLEFIGNCKKRPTQSGLEKELNIFIDLVQQRYHKRPILYVTYEFYDLYLRDKYRDSPIWISDFYSWNKLPVLADRKPWTFWQYSERGRVKGINHPVDLDVFNGDNAQFQQLINAEVIAK